MNPQLPQPRLFRRHLVHDANALQALRNSAAPPRQNDVLYQQILQLAKIRSPQRWAGTPLRDHEHTLAVAEILAGRTLAEYGIDVYLPWNHTLTRILPPDDYQELRTARNRDKLTADEQQRLRQLTIAVAGMSSGAVIAITLALGGLCGELRLADFDTLDTTNLNRLPAGVHELGLNKAVVCARRILENNPYQKIGIFEEGVTTANLATFIDADGQLDIIIEQMDDLEMKWAIRQAARTRKIPVLMETNDLGRLDVERFDQEPQRPLLHGLLAHHAPSALRHPNSGRRMQVILDLLQRRPSNRLASSFLALGRSVSGWPQLAHEVMLGAATVAHAVQRIGLGEPLPSGRYGVDLSEILSAEPELAAGVGAGAGGICGEARGASAARRGTRSDVVCVGGGVLDEDVA